MYLTTVTKPTNADPVRGRVAGNVVALGAVSLITDISSEMVAAILPVFLFLNLHLSPAAFGAIDGLYTGATALLRLVGGYVADRTQQRKLVAGIGYGLSALMKPALLLAGRSAAAIGAVIAIDRAGKGLRTAPRDALITLSSAPESLGRAFGVHRAMDSTGAFLGPLLAMAVLALTAESFDAVFITSFCIAMFGVLVLVLFVRDHRDPLEDAPRVEFSQVRGMIASPAILRLLIASCILGLVTIGDGFVYLVLQGREDLGIAWFPLLSVGTMAVYMLLAVPLGALGDKIGLRTVMMGGYVALGLVYLLLVSPIHGIPSLVLAVILYGIFYAATNGVLIALAGPVIPAHLRTTGIALIQTGQALAYLVSSIAFGVAWGLWGPVAACKVSAGAVALAIAASLFLLRRTTEGLAA
ncbi:MFS transporter [Nocardioides gansuensis]|uniref:MFS transporter n=1 Tax=Nocardioides gansuensis TaxID=2138300 RepID=A0A2T8F5Y1_9ACTN|nr:MFS transporter [Nocardioides gansuensis]PVG81132.1 MFS transporter [Nocardioides gansuensis]